MNTKIEFYLLKEASLESFYKYVCVLVEKSYEYGKKIYIHCQSPLVVQRLDVLLWTFRDVSFLPHERLQDDVSPCCPIVLGSDEQKLDRSGDILINLCDEVPGFYSNFGTVIEIVCDDADAKKAARKRYKYYSDNKNQLVTHKDVVSN